MFSLIQRYTYQSTYRVYKRNVSLNICISEIILQSKTTYAQIYLKPTIWTNTKYSGGL